LVHRALLGDAKADSGRDGLEAIGDHISATERRAADAERAAIDRYRATLLARSVGSLFTADISGVASFGLFVRLRENGADGLVPISTLPGDYYVRDERAQRLVGRNTGRIYQLGEEVPVRLVEADGIGGRLVFRIEEETTTHRGPAAGRGRQPRVKTGPRRRR
jgi:ribonuclease R